MNTTSSLLAGLLLSLAAAESIATAPPLTEIAPPATGIGAAGEYFGAAIAIDGSRRVVGVFNRVRVDPDVLDGVRSGAVLVYDGDSTPKLLQLPNGQEGDLFGSAVALCGEWLLVGAPLVDAGGEDAGAVYAFRDVGGIYELQRRFEGDAVDQRLGATVACGSGHGAAGGKGRALAFTLGAAGPPLLSLKLASASHAAAVAVDAQNLWALAPNPAGSLLSRHALTGGTSTGSLSLPGSDAASLLLTPDGALTGLAGAEGGRGLVLRIRGEAGLSLSGTLPAPGTQTGRYGHALAVNAEGTRLLVGAPGIDDSAGAAYWYARQGTDWVFRGALQGPGEVALLGEAVALAGNEAWVGAPLQAVPDGLEQGVVRRWSLPDPGAAQTLPTLDLGRSAARSRFAQAIAAADGQLLVGAFLADSARGADTGLAWVYPPDGGAPDRLAASDGRPDSRYGIAVALQGGRALVGAYFDAVNGQIDRGSAYVHERIDGQWVERQKLVASNGNIREFFGLAVALADGTAVIGAPGATVDATGAGRVHVFRRDAVGNWNEEQELTAPAPALFANYGRSVALSGGRLYVGEPFATAGTLAEAGQVHVYRDVDGVFVHERSLREPAGLEGAAFGFALSATPAAVLIGAPQSVGAAGRTGRAWLWRPTDADRLIDLTPGGLQIGELYGLAVQLSEDAALVGGSGFDGDGVPDQGRAHYWRWRGGDWLHRQSWVSPRSFTEQFGRSLALDGDAIYVGAPNAARLSPQEGAVYRAEAGELLGASGFERAPTVPAESP
ncbi:MAG: FG-GAP repeat protein [Xanthomonadales bacterium]|jgi:hypothetical protein|nr:FG-GAP repeat protein [Xanthomonadales bacterium]